MCFHLTTRYPLPIWMLFPVPPSVDFRCFPSKQSSTDIPESWQGGLSGSNYWTSFFEMELPSQPWGKIQPVLHFEWLLEKQRVKSKVLFTHQKTKLYTSTQWKNKVLSFLFSIAEDGIGANNNNWEKKKVFVVNVLSFFNLAEIRQLIKG